MTVTSLVDDKAGNLLAAFKAANGGSDVLAYGASVTFCVTQTLAVADAGDSYTNVVNGGRAGRRGQPDQRHRHGHGELHGRAAPIDIAKSAQPGDGQRGRGGRCRA